MYDTSEIKHILETIDKADNSSDTFRKSENLFAVRQVLKEIPDLFPLVFSDKLKRLISSVFGNDYFVVKSIYFDKPGGSNWFVAWHQDLTISVKEKTEIEGYGPWTTKHNQYAVQPPLHVLENIYTIRIHLDDTDKNNGALKVIIQSHNKGIYRPDTINRDNETEITCSVPAGGIMLMKPLIMHSSSRTVNDNRRRVLHIEFTNMQFSEGLFWSERQSI